MQKGKWISLECRGINGKHARNCERASPLFVANTFLECEAKAAYFGWDVKREFCANCRALEAKLRKRR